MVNKRNGISVFIIYVKPHVASQYFFLVKIILLFGCKKKYYLKMHLFVKLRSRSRSGLLQVWFSLQPKFNSFEIDSEVGRLVITIIISHKTSVLC